MKNKIRAMGVKNPIIMQDPEELEKDFAKIASADTAKLAVKEATYPSDFVKGSGVAKKKYGRPQQHEEPTDRYGRRIQKGRV